MDGTQAAYLISRTSRPYFPVGKLFRSCNSSTPVPIQFVAGSRLFWSKRIVNFGGACIPSRVLLLPRGIFSILSTQPLLRAIPYRVSGNFFPHYSIENEKPLGEAAFPGIGIVLIQVPQC